MSTPVEYRDREGAQATTGVVETGFLGTWEYANVER
jgi:hypothetical protein